MNFFAPNFMSNFGNGEWGMPFPFHILPFFAVLSLWSLFWKGLALWRAGRRGEGWWFGILLVVNTLGILEMVYLFGVAKRNINNLFSKD